MSFAKGKHLPALDGLRGFAVVLVIFFHYFGSASKSHRLLIRAFTEITHFGWSGVSLFFVLSGFLITGILWDSFEQPGWWKRIYLRRSVRIFPLYYLAILLVLIASALYGYAGQTLRNSWVYMLYLQDLPPLPREAAFSPVLETFHLWSLAVEEQFYLLWPFLLFLMPNRLQAKRLCLATFAASLVFRAAVVHFHADLLWADQFLLGRMGELSAGGWLALAMRGTEEDVQRVSRAGAVLLPVSLVSVAALILARKIMAIADPWITVLGLALLAVLFASLLARSIAGGLLQRFFEMMWLRWLGRISYGLYIYHALFAPLYGSGVRRWLRPHSHNMEIAAIFVVGVVGTIAIATLSFYFFETPFLRLKDRLKMPAPARTARGF